MGDFLKDGTGLGYFSRVDSNHELHTRSRTVQMSSSKALSGDLYIAGSNIYPVSTTQGLMTWMYFTDTVNSLAVAEILVSWNGGDTNYNRPAELSFRAGTGAPSGNTSTISLRNTNTSSANVLSHTAYEWDGVGNGMTGASQAAEVNLSNYIISPGVTHFPVNGKIIFGPGTPMGMYAKGIETGRLCVVIYFYLYDPTIDLQ